MRTLTYIPIIHTEADMGDLKDALRARYIREYGKEKWDEHVRVIDELWNGIRKKILELNLDFSRLKLYQDGLPVCGREAEIVRELARRGSRNHLLLAELMDRGALLVGTESPEFLRQEYGNLRAALTRAATADSARLLKARDRFIARRIDRTLLEAEHGLLFIGLIHEVHRYLPETIQVGFLIYRLPFAHDVHGRLDPGALS